MEGTWKRERVITLRNGDKLVETANWTCKPAAGGKATVTQGKWGESGAEWVMIAGWNSDEVLYEHGRNSTGLVWTGEYKKDGDDILSGTMSGVVEGLKFTGTSKIEKTGQDSYTVTWEATLATGEVRKGTARNSRVAAAAKGK